MPGNLQLVDSISHDLDYHFKSHDLVVSALTHPCLNYKRRNNMYERLEFLGDRVLGLVIADILYHTYPNVDEGALSRSYISLVKTETLENVAKDLNLSHYLLLAGLNVNQIGANILADTCEALIAAIYIDGGIDAVRKFIKHKWKPYIENQEHANKDAKSELQEFTQAWGQGIPEYNIISVVGSDHDPRFTVEVSIPKLKLSARAKARNKKSAEQVAAEKLLTYIKKQQNDPID